MGPHKLQFDYCYIRSDVVLEREEDGSRPKQPWATTPVGIGESTQTPMAISVPMKEANTDYKISSVVNFA